MKIRRPAHRAGNKAEGIPAAGRAGAGILALLLGMVLMLAACGQVRPLPAHVELGDYALITYQELLASGPAKLQSGQKIKVPAYFWEFISYDPAMVRIYLNMINHPLSWYKLQWFATYGTPDLKGYFDLAALDPSQKKAYLRLRRLDHVMLYGELASLGPGLYLQVHHIERIEED